MADDICFISKYELNTLWAVFCVGSNALKTADFNNLFDLALEAMTAGVNILARIQKCFPEANFEI